MKLGERLAAAGRSGPGAVPARPAAARPAGAPTDVQPETGRPRASRPGLGQPLETLKGRARDRLYARLGSRLYDADLDETQLAALVESELSRAFAAEPFPLSEGERRVLVEQVTVDVMGYGPLAGLLADPSVSEIMVNGTGSIYVERGGLLARTPLRFSTAEHARRVIERMAAQVGRRIDESSPMVDARLADGSRLNAVIPPLAVDGPVLTIRRFPAQPLGVDYLVSVGTLTAELVTLLAACVAGRLNIIISGGTGTGKTTLLNVLSSFVGPGERIVTIEDAVELRLRQDHVVRLESRPANIEGRGEVNIRDLVRNALRMRPDRIIVGEVRGGEALDMLQAMNTGNDGSLSTVHANSPADALSRVETMVLMGGVDLPSRAIREQMASAFDLVIQLTRTADGGRRVSRVCEVVGMAAHGVEMADLFVTDPATGHLAATGHEPGFAPRLAGRGVTIGWG
ncbi:MAG: CpaF family protein [Acidimicrobiales bacterium]